MTTPLTPLQRLKAMEAEATLHPACEYDAMMRRLGKELIALWEGVQEADTTFENADVVAEALAALNAKAAELFKGEP